MEKSENSRDITETIGCGTVADLVTPSITININTTTGGNFAVVVESHNSVEILKKIVSKKLRVSKDRICLLHRERELLDGTLKDNGLMDGSKIILIPNVETGLLAQRPENTVMQALESLNDTQVNDFLSGKSPLNLSMRLGDHMMLIQLQLSTLNPSSSSSTSSSSSSSSSHGIRSRNKPKTHTNPPTIHFAPQVSQSVTAQSSSSSSSSSTITPSPLLSTSTSSNDINNDSSSRINDSEKLLKKIKRHSLVDFAKLATSTRTICSSAVTESPVPSDLYTLPPTSSTKEILFRREIEKLQHIVKSLQDKHKKEQEQQQQENLNNDCKLFDEQQSPIKSLSNLVSNSMETTTTIPIIKRNIPVDEFTTIDGMTAAAASSSPSGTTTTSSLLSSPSSSSSQSTIGATLNCPDPISAKLTSCLCKSLETNSNNCDINCQIKQEQNQLLKKLYSSKSTPIMLTPSSIASSSSIIVPNESSSTTTITETAISSSDNKSSSWRTSLLHKTANNPIIKNKNKVNNVLFRKTINNQLNDSQINTTSTINNSTSNVSGTSSSSSSSSSSTTSSLLLSDNSSIDSSMPELDDTINGTTIIDSCALAEASRNLTQTLRKLSKEVFTNKMDVNDDNTRRMGTGAVIESMKNHGRGIYSGTFSGTLNPALQDRNGRPKRDISTIIHILNDLLSAAPQYRRGAKIKFEPSINHRSAIKEIPRTRHTESQTDQETCTNCLYENKTIGSTTAGTSCQYGECKGHFNSNNTTTTTEGGLTTNKNINCLNKHSNNQHNHHHHHHNQCYCQKDDTTTTLSSLKALNQITLDESLDDTTLKISCRCNSNTTQQSTINNYHNNITTTNHIDNNSENNEFIDKQQQQRIITKICNKCNNTEIENNKTKCKLDHLRLVMQQKKENREARKLKTLPYNKTRLVGTATATSATLISGGQTTADVPPNHNVEEVDTAA